MANTNMNARERAALEEQKKDRKIRNRFIIVGVIIVLLAALVIVVNSRLFTNTFPALKVTDGSSNTNYALADVNYAYQSAYNSIAQTYSSYGLYDTSKSPKEQPCLFMSDGGTWDDYFKEQAESSLVEKTAVLKAARDAGYTELTVDEQAQIDSVIDSFAAYAPYYGGSVNSFIALNFGAGNTEKTIRNNMAEELLINRYLKDIQNGYTYTEDQLNDYYTEHQDQFDKVNYLYTVISGAADEEAGLDETAAMAAAKEKAETIVQNGAEGEEAFREAVSDIAETDPSDTSATISSFNNLFGDDAVAEPGACFVHEAANSCYAVYVLSLDDNDYNTVNVRHILIKAVDEDGDGEYSEAEKQAAYDAVKAIEDEWLAGEATEDSFAALANEKSEDAGSNTKGGLYENVYKGYTVKEFDEFCFAGHQHGDTAIVYGETSSYAGYHLVYFVGEGDNYRQILAGDDMRSTDYNEYYHSLLAPYTSQRTFMWRYVMKAA